MIEKSVIGKGRTMDAQKRAANRIVDMLSGDQAKEARAAESNWRERPAAEQQALLKGLHMLSDIEQLANDDDIQKLLENIDQPHSDFPNRQLPWRPIALAASVLIGVIITLLVIKLNEPLQMQFDRYITRTGEQKTVELEDGSVITLNTATQLLVAISDNERRIVLDRGEAYFAVAKDANRPFTVQVDGRSVTALGTAFNIRNDLDHFKLAVVEGIVAIHQPSTTPSLAAPLLDETTPSPRLLTGQYRIEAGMVIDYDLKEHGIKATKPENVSSLFQWRTGMIGFNAVPLSEVVKELNRYSAKKILIEDTSIMDLKLYAGIRLDRLDISLMGIEASLPVTVKTYIDRIVIVGRQ
ncbi:FecR domain-containing protein [Porticoccaceae bacterium LTM1]|nr:FecR domain-containing protein [Porticoccaceae bacterium LTM1]